MTVKGGEHAKAELGLSGLQNFNLPLKLGCSGISSFCTQRKSLFFPSRGGKGLRLRRALAPAELSSLSTAVKGRQAATRLHQFFFGRAAGSSFLHYSLTLLQRK